MDNPSNSRADGAYDRALAAYQDNSYEVARRWTLEALAYNRQHSGARALLGRLDAAVRGAANPFQSAGSGSEVISTDPTVLISRASQPATSEPIEPTVMARPDDPRRRPAAGDARAAVPPPNRQPVRPAVDPTVIAQPSRKASPARPKPSFSLGASLQSLGERFQGRASRPRESTPARGRSTAPAGSWISTPTGRGALIAVATVVVGALLIWGVFGLFRWLWPGGQLLTIKPPVGGTITGPGLNCGTRGSECSTTIANGEPVELKTEPDKDFVFSGYTGDCAPAGRTLMTQARNCSATFERPAAASAPVTFMLTITKPEGGTIVAAPGILCGADGSSCSAEIPIGAPVTLKGNAAEGYVFDRFTGDCPGTGEMTMSSAKTCGATFLKTAGQVVNRDPVQPQGPSGRVGRGPSRGGPPLPGPIPVVPKPSPEPAPKPTPPEIEVAQPPTGPAKDPISRDEHAKLEIQILLKKYCAALQTLKHDAVRSLYNQNNEPDHLKEQLREYKSLKCMLAPEPPVYSTVDTSETGGVVKLQFGMKRVIEMRSGGAPKDYETIVTMVVSRKNYLSPWLIDRATHEEKPK